MRSKDRAGTLVPWISGASVLIQTFDISGFVVAVPAIATEFHVDPVGLSQAIFAYLIGAAIAVSVSHWMCDRFGVRQIYLGSLFMFALASAVCALANDPTSLTAARFATGVFSGLFGATARTALVDAVAKPSLARIMSYVAMPAMLGPALGPILGGLVVETWTWRWLFLIPLPILAIILLAVYIFVPNGPTMREQFDVTGFALFSPALILSVFIVHTTETGGFGIRTPVMLVISILLIGFYIRHAVRSERPLLIVTPFRERPFALTMTGSALTRIAAGGMPLLVSLALQVGDELKALDTGLVLGAYAIGLAIARPAAPLVTERFGCRFAMIAANLVNVLCALALAWCILSQEYWATAAIMFIGGGAMSLHLNTFHAMAYVADPNAPPAGVTALVGVMQQLTAGVGAAVVFALVPGFAVFGTATSFALTAVILGLLTCAAFPVYFALRPQDEALLHTQQ